MNITFVTLFYNDPVEIQLLRLQARSFSFVEYGTFEKILIVYNDNGNTDLRQVVKEYPVAHRHKVEVIPRDTFCTVCGTSWFNQQLSKLMVARVVLTDFYLIMDCKDHFIRHVSKSVLFPCARPIMVLGWSGMYDAYKYCLDYFAVECPFGFPRSLEDLRPAAGGTLQTGPPYVFIRDEVLTMINFIESREHPIRFCEFFMERAMKKLVTEFFLYGAWLIRSGGIAKYKCTSRNLRAGVFNQFSAEWNKIETKQQVVHDENFKVFTLHRNAISEMDEAYKLKLLRIYSSFFSNDTVYLIAHRILRVRKVSFSREFVLQVYDQILGTLGLNLKKFLDYFGEPAGFFIVVRPCNLFMKKG